MTARINRRSAALTRLTAVAALAVAGTLVLTGCGDQTKKDSGSNAGGSTPSASTSHAPLFAKLPKKFQDSGVIKVGTDASYAPMEQTENGQIVGIDPDIAAALSKQLGVKFKFTNGQLRRSHHVAVLRPRRRRHVRYERHQGPPAGTGRQGQEDR